MILGKTRGITTPTPTENTPLVGGVFSFTKTVASSPHL